MRVKAKSKQKKSKNKNMPSALPFFGIEIQVENLSVQLLFMIDDVNKYNV